MHRTILLMLLALGLSGCKTAEVVVDYPVTGIRVAAKFEARDPAPAVVPGAAADHAHRNRDTTTMQ